MYLPLTAASNNVTVVALPGMGGTAWSFPSSLFTAMRSAGCTVIAITYGPVMSSIPAMAEGVWATLERASCSSTSSCGVSCGPAVGNLVLMGYSMGGFVAQAMLRCLQARTRPGTVIGVILLASAAPEITLSTAAHMMRSMKRGSAATSTTTSRHDDEDDTSSSSTHRRDAPRSASTSVLEGTGPGPARLFNLPSVRLQHAAPACHAESAAVYVSKPVFTRPTPLKSIQMVFPIDELGTELSEVCETSNAMHNATSSMHSFAAMETDERCRDNVAHIERHANEMRQFALISDAQWSQEVYAIMHYALTNGASTTKLAWAKADAWYRSHPIPVLIIHGDADRVIPYSSTASLRRAMSYVGPVTVQRLRGDGHGFVLYDAQACGERMATWMNVHKLSSPHPAAGPAVRSGLPASPRRVPHAELAKLPVTMDLGTLTIIGSAR